MGKNVTVVMISEWMGTVLEIVQMILKSPSLGLCINLFTHSFSKCLLSNYYTPGTLLDTEGLMVSKT